MHSVGGTPVPSFADLLNVRSKLRIMLTRNQFDIQHDPLHLGNNSKVGTLPCLKPS